ncbi:unnamed protein product [Adineta ricciae]|uniref:Uncharacterized protein n=1 Tax=Adineta ricciae TaxID=249248 RepID=A0A814BAI5_ADIRI|nr:unnamed protein product [Adineta ricciae]
MQHALIFTNLFLNLLMSKSPSKFDPCDLRSNKFARMLSKPIGDQILDKIPGIGMHTSEKLQKTKRMTKAEDLLREFAHTFRSNDEEFRLWLMKDYALPEYRATECTIALIDYIAQAKKNCWPLP